MTSRMAALKDEATRIFLGQGGVVGVAEGAGQGLTVLLQAEDAPHRQAVRDWAADNDVEVRFLVSGRLGGVGARSV
jgi:hypothetical protein